MKYIYLTLREPPERRNPMHTFVMEHPSFERAALIAWNTAREDVDVLLFRVTGEVPPYREALEAAPFANDYDLTRIDAESFYAYVEHETRRVDAEFRAAFFDRRLLSVPPIEYDERGRIRLRVVGRPADLEGALEDLPDDIEVDVGRVGEYDADVADRLGCAESTASNHLRKA